MTRSLPAWAPLPCRNVPRLRALLLLLLPAVPLSVVGLVAGCEDVRLPAIVPDGGSHLQDAVVAVKGTLAGRG